LFLEALDQRLAPSSAAILSQSGNTLTITEYTSYSDIITETNVFGGKYSITTSANGGNAQNFSNVSNIVFNAATSGINVLFNSSGGTYNTSGNISVNSTTNFVGTFIEFDGTQNVQGAVTVAQTGIGDTTDFVALNGSHFGSLTVTGGSPINSSNSGNTFVNVSDTIHNASGNTSIQGTMVDLEGVTVAGATTINFGAGGGYFLTDYTIDLGNSGNDGFNPAPAEVHFGGNLSITDLRTRRFDTFDMYNAGVGGNLSINVSSIGVSEGIGINAYSIGNNLTVTMTATGDANDSVYIANSSVLGNAAFTQTGAEYADAYIYFTSVNGSLSATQSGGYYAEVDVYGDNGSQAQSVGAVTIKQTSSYDETYLTNLSTIKGAVSVTQNGSYENYVGIANDNTLNSSVTIIQSPSYDNTSIGNVSINGAVTVNQSAAQEDSSFTLQNAAITTGGLTVTQALAGVSSGGEAYVYTYNASIKGNVSITQGQGFANDIYIELSSINGALTVKQAPTVTNANVFELYNGSSVNGSLTVTQNGKGAFDYVYVGNGSYVNTSANVNGSVTITQGGVQGEVYLGYGPSYVNGSVTVNQAVADNSYFIVNNETITGAVKDTQTGNNIDLAVLETTSINGSAALSQNQAGPYIGIYVNNASINGSLTISQASPTYYYPFQYYSASFEYEPYSIVLENSQVNGSMTITHAINGGGYYAEAYIYNMGIAGNVSVNQGGGTYNDLEIHDSSINGSLTVNQSAATTYQNELYIDESTQINGSATITQSAATYDNASIGNASLKSSVTIKQLAVYSSETEFDNASITGAISVTLGIGYDDFYVEGGSTLAGNVSVTANSAHGTDVFIDSSSLSKSLTVSAGAGHNLFEVTNASIIGNVSANMNGTGNYVDIYDTTVFGTTTLNLGIGLTANNVIDIESDPDAGAGTAFHGAVTVGMGDGTNTVNVGENGSVTFLVNSSFAANISGYNTYNESNVSGAGVLTFRNF
jgi:hypothetical protein